MPDFTVVLRDPNGELEDVSLVLRLNKAPKTGSWFDLGDGTPAQAREIRRISGDIVIFAEPDTESGNQRLKS